MSGHMEYYCPFCDIRTGNYNIDRKIHKGRAYCIHCGYYFNRIGGNYRDEIEKNNKITISQALEIAHNVFLRHGWSINNDLFDSRFIEELERSELLTSTWYMDRNPKDDIQEFLDRIATGGDTYPSDIERREN